MVRGCRMWCGAAGVVLALGLVGCAAKQAPTPKERVGEGPTPMPTVPPATPGPDSTPVAIATRPIGRDIKATKGLPIGPVVTFFGAGRADGSFVEPINHDKKGRPVYRSEVGSGFMLIVEAKPGESGYEVGRRVFAHVPDDPTVRPDLEIQSSRDLGDGSREVCDRRRPKIGGIPGINPPSFKETQRVADAINDLACRFETFIESDAGCTLNKNGDYQFINADSSTQFCMIVARAYLFPVGRTLLSVRLRDVEGNPGPVKEIWIERPKVPAPPKKRSPQRPEKKS